MNKSKPPNAIEPVAAMVLYNSEMVQAGQLWYGPHILTGIQSPNQGFLRVQQKSPADPPVQSGPLIQYWEGHLWGWTKPI